MILSVFTHITDGSTVLDIFAFLYVFFYMYFYI